MNSTTTFLHKLITLKITLHIIFEKLNSTTMDTFDIGKKNRLYILLGFISILNLSCFSKATSSSKILRFNQDRPIVYTTPKFKVVKETDIVYAQGLRYDYQNSSNPEAINLKLDIYYPDSTYINRPLYFFIHGGGFKEGSKSGKAFLKLANYFASRGWVFVSIDYRLKKDFGTTPKAWADFTKTADLSTKIKNLNAIYPAVRDAKAALRWVAKHADNYKISTNHIKVGGGSAGAMMAIALGLSEPEDFTNELSFEEDYTLKSTSPETPYSIKSITSFWGSSLALDVFNGVYGKKQSYEGAPPILIAHGKYDKIVNIMKAKELVKNYQAQNIPYSFYPIEKQGHALWNTMFDGKSLEELAFSFMVEQQKLKVN